MTFVEGPALTTHEFDAQLEEEILAEAALTREEEEPQQSVKEEDLDEERDPELDP